MQAARSLAAPLVAVALLALVGPSVAAQQRARSRQEPPVAPHANDIEASYIRMPLPPGEERYGRLDGARMKQFVNEITRISRQSRDDGNRYWGRIAGTRYTEITARLVAERFREFGLQDVHLQPIELQPQWFPTDWDFSATGGGKTLTFESIHPGGRSTPTPSAGLDLEAVWVGLGSELDFAGRDVGGKLVVIHSSPNPSGFQHTAAYGGALNRASEKGAAAVLVNIAIPGNYTNHGRSAPGVPTFSIGTEDAAALRALMAEGAVTVHARLQTEMRSGLTDYNVWGTLPGATTEEILVIAHSDGYFEAAFDNASGMAVMLGLAEYFSQIPQAQRRRTLKFVSTAAHHTGSPGTRWMHDNRDTVLAKAVLVLNCEHTSITETYEFGPVLRKSNSIAARRWWVHGSDKLASLVLNAYQIFGVTIFDGMEPRASGDMGAISRDLPSSQLIVSPVYYHSDHDRSDIVPDAGLEAVGRAYAKIIDEVNELEAHDLKQSGAPSGQQ